LTAHNAYVGDFNKDKRPDYIIEMFSGGNGIPPSDVVFIVSSGSDYEITVFGSYARVWMILWIYGGDGGFQYIPMFVFGSDIKGQGWKDT